MITLDKQEYLYSGPSMNPTFMPGDRLRVVPYVSRKITVGDVIVFRVDGMKIFITHRVTGIVPTGVVTRGDNNSAEDSYCLKPHEIMGYVITASRGRRIRQVGNGRKGLMYARFVWMSNAANRVVSRVLHPVYRKLARTGVFSRSLSRWTRPTVIRFTKSAGEELQLFFGRHFIGRRLPGQKEWQIRRPYRLFIDPMLLHE